MKLQYVLIPMIFAGLLGAQGRGYRNSTTLTPPTSAQTIQHEVNRLTRYFGLTSTQVTEVTGFLTTEQSCLQGDTTTAQTDREALITAIKSGNAGSISTAINNLTSVEAAQATCRATAAAAIYGDLTSTQQGKLGTGLGPLLGGGAGALR
jgi:hypothetical protein